MVPYLQSFKLGYFLFHSAKVLGSFSVQVLCLVPKYTSHPLAFGNLQQKGHLSTITCISNVGVKFSSIELVAVAQVLILIGMFLLEAANRVRCQSGFLTFISCQPQDPYVLPKR